jgi:hypothetical protein
LPECGKGGVDGRWTRRTAEQTPSCDRQFIVASNRRMHGDVVDGMEREKPSNSITETAAHIPGV